MSIADAVPMLRSLAKDLGPTADLAALGSLAVSLPPSHLELLQQLNGMTIFHGAFRLFGVRAEPWLDLIQWNAAETWRFAWDDRVEPFLVFAETAWGDQYAYRWSKSGDELEPQVYFLEGTLLRPRAFSESFDDFLVNEFIRNAQDPYDEMVTQAVSHRGAISADKHWVYVPSVALGGPELIDNVIEMPAITAMTYAGDIASALRASRPGTNPTAVEPWTDGEGRSRLRLSFA
jgi:SMI1/KNR4 family protein SUKH-1